MNELIKLSWMFNWMFYTYLELHKMPDVQYTSIKQGCKISSIIELQYKPACHVYRVHVVLN